MVDASLPLQDVLVWASRSVHPFFCSCSFHNHCLIVVEPELSQDFYWIILSLPIQLQYILNKANDTCTVYKMGSRSSYTIGGRVPMTPPDSRSQTMRSDEDFSARRIMPFSRPMFDSSVYEEPQDILAGQGFQQQLQNVVHNQAPSIAPHHPHQQAISLQYNNQPYQNYMDPTRAIRSPPPQDHYPSRSVPVDEEEYRELLRQASERTGHKYGNTIMKGGASVHQGNVYDGPEPPKDMKQHEYGDTVTEETGTGRPRVLKGDSSAQALHRMDFWHGRAPQERTHSGNNYPRHSGRR